MGLRYRDQAWGDPSPRMWCTSPTAASGCPGQEAVWEVPGAAGSGLRGKVVHAGPGSASCLDAGPHLQHGRGLCDGHRDSTA